MPADGEPGTEPEAMSDSTWSTLTSWSPRVELGVGAVVRSDTAHAEAFGITHRLSRSAAGRSRTRRSVRAV